MLRTLLALAMIATQVLSWNASPLYLCLGEDGSVCLDFGPASCGCCEHDEAAAEHPAADHACDQAGNHAGETQQIAATGIDLCGCLHIQISEPQAATLPQSAFETQQRTATPAAIASQDAWFGLPSTAAEPLILPFDGPTTAQAILASVVMRC